MTTPISEVESIVRQNLGLNDTPKLSWTYDQRIAYNKALSAEILRRSSEFSANQIKEANKVLASPTDHLEDASFDVGQFFEEAGKPLGNALQSIGDGVFSVANAARWAIPVIAVVFVVFYFLPKYFAAKKAAK